jgi:predicted metal-dependent hydrolase
MPATGQCAEAMERGRAAFNRGAFFDAHELWEEAWRVLEGSERVLVQGLIQIAAGLHHLQNHRPRPAARLLASGADKLGGAAADPGDLRVDMLLGDVARLLAVLATPGASAPDPLDVKLDTR